jgi:outer membrane lipopolysaccharide assembly protein LptE/RlpB
MGSKSSLSPKLNNVYLQADNNYEPFIIKLKNQLVSYGIVFADKPTAAPFILHFYPTEFTHSTATSGPSTQARVYNLTYSVSFDITDSSGKVIVPTKKAVVTRDLTLMPNDIFEISTLVGVTKTNMEQELVVRTLNILSSRQVTEALNAAK